MELKFNPVYTISIIIIYYNINIIIIYMIASI
jgi:hypothetical protein